MYGYSQKEYDPETHLNYFGSRYYDSSTGTWLTQDKYRGNIVDPSSLHRYAYVNNNPINYFDPWGSAVGYTGNFTNMSYGEGLLISPQSFFDTPTSNLTSAPNNLASLPQISSAGVYKDMIIKDVHIAAADAIA